MFYSKETFLEIVKEILTPESCGFFKFLDANGKITYGVQFEKELSIDLKTPFSSHQKSAKIKDATGAVCEYLITSFWYEDRFEGIYAYDVSRGVSIYIAHNCSNRIFGEQVFFKDPDASKIAYNYLCVGLRETTGDRIYAEDVIKSLIQHFEIMGVKPKESNDQTPEAVFGVAPIFAFKKMRRIFNEAGFGRKEVFDFAASIWTKDGFIKTLWLKKPNTGLMVYEFSDEENK